MTAARNNGGLPQQRPSRRRQLESSGEDDPRASTVDATTRAQAALAVADLGNSRRDYITSIDNRAGRVDLAWVNRTRECNIEGTEAAEQAEQNSSLMSAWNNPASFGGNVGPDSVEINHGQSHRARMAREVRIELAAMKEREPKEHPAKRSKYTSGYRPLDPALQYDDDYDPVAAYKADPTSYQPDPPLAAGIGRVRSAQPRPTGALAARIGRGEPTPPRPSLPLAARVERNKLIPPRPGRVRNASAEHVSKRPRSQTSQNTARPAPRPRYSPHKLAANPEVDAVKRMLEQVKFGSISSDDFAQSFWKWQKLKDPSKEPSEDGEIIEDGEIATASRQNVPKVQKAVISASQVGQLAQTANALAQSKTSNQYVQPKDAASQPESRTAESRKSLKLAPTAVTSWDGFLKCINPRITPAKPSDNTETAPTLANTKPKGDGLVASKSTSDLAEVVSNHHEVQTLENISTSRADSVRTASGKSTISDVTASLRTLSITDNERVKVSYGSGTMTLMDDSDSESAALPSPTLIPLLPRKAPPKEIMLYGHKYIIADSVAATRLEYVSPFHNAVSMEREKASNTSLNPPPAFVPAPVSDIVARQNPSTVSDKPQVPGPTVLTAPVTDKLAPEDLETINGRLKIHNPPINEPQLFDPPAKLPEKQKEAAITNPSSGLEASRWSSESTASTQSQSSARPSSPNKISKPSSRVGIERKTRVNAGPAFLNMMKDMKARANGSEQSTTASSP